MIQLAIRAVVSLLANAIGLIAADWLLDDFEIDWTSFIIAVAIFTVATVVLGPLVIKIALTSAPFLMGGIALVTTLVGLALTNALSDGISISGVGTWIAATVVIWFFAMVANVALPWIILKAGLGADDERGAPAAAPPNQPPLQR